MNIDALNATNPIKKSRPSFSGHVLTKDVYGNDIYKFNVPNAPEGAKLEIAVLTPDENGNFSINHDKTRTFDMEQGFKNYIIYADDYNLTNNSILGYRIHVPNKIISDSSIKGDKPDVKEHFDKRFTLATPLNNANPSRPRVMEHFLIDAFNVKNSTGLLTKRNHFNILGGTINSINELVPDFAQAGITAFLSTPVFGQDNKSSHGYWTTNPYQITDNLGNITDFKKLLINMYSHDIRWTADGAFVNEGMEGVHIRDIMNWGYDSPLLHLFETKDLDNIPSRFGILSKNPAVNRHVHIQLVNAPYKIIFEKTPNGYIEKEIKKNSVDPTKPTYIQVFDDRLASERQMKGEFIFNVYDNKDTGDNKEIANYRDSVQAYHFRVSLREVEDNYKKYKEARHHDKGIQFKNSLTKWRNFEIVESNKDGGISLWVGNSDISKKRFVLPEESIYFQNLPESLKPVVKAAPNQVQDDTVQIGKFWTQEVERTFTEYTAREIGEKIAQKMSYEAAVNALITEHKLPESAKVILDKENGISALENILTKDVFSDGRNYNLKPVKMPQNITDGMMSYPFDAIEFSPDLVSVFTYPYIKNMAVTEDTIGKTRYEMYQMGDEYYNEMPEKYRDIYKKMDSVIANDFSNHAVDILKKLEARFNDAKTDNSTEKIIRKFVDENNELTTEGKEIYSLIASDIVKFLTVTALAPQIQPKYDEKFLNYDTKELGKIDLNSLNLQYEITPEDTALKLIAKIQSGLKNIDKQDKLKDKKEVFINSLYDRLQNVNSDNFNVAKLIIEKTEAGLDWRIDAAKDVGDSDAVADGTFSQEKNKTAIYKFWNRFNTGVREYNPNSFTIGELTNWDKSVFAEFLQKTGFTTLSDYDYFYSTLPGLFGKNDEGRSFTKLADVFEDRFFTKILTDNEGKAQQNEDGTKKINLGYFDTGLLEHVNYAHRFVGNHDKPRILHLFATDVSLLNKNKAQAVAEAIKNRALAKSTEFNKLDQNFKNTIYAAVDTLEQGDYHQDGKLKEYDAENFGVRPFDFVIDDIIEEAIETNKDFKSYARNNIDAVNKLKADILQEMLRPALEKYKAMWLIMNAIPGTPTNYAGDELGMTGWEFPCKNEKQEDRNALRWDRINNPNYNFIADFKNKLDAITRMRKKEAASALVNGTTMKLANQPINKCDPALTLYRYNDKTDAICVLHNAGFGPLPEQYPSGEVHINRIDLTGLPNGLPVGTIYRDALNPEEKYKVTNPYEIKKIDNNNPDIVLEDVNLHNSGLILLRETNFNNKTFSFKGRIENPHVKLANTKYNFSYMKN